MLEGERFQQRMPAKGENRVIQKNSEALYAQWSLSHVASADPEGPTHIVYAQENMLIQSINGFIASICTSVLAQDILPP